MEKLHQHISERIAHIAKAEGITIRRLELMVGTSQGVLNKIVKNNGDLKCSIAAKILELFPHYSAEWLVCGTGTPLKGKHNPCTDPEEPVVSALFQRIDQQAVENARLNEKIDRLLKQHYQKHIESRIAAEPDSSKSEKTNNTSKDS